VGDARGRSVSISPLRAVATATPSRKINSRCLILKDPIYLTEQGALGIGKGSGAFVPISVSSPPRRQAKQIRKLQTLQIFSNIAFLHFLTFTLHFINKTHKETNVTTLYYSLINYKHKKLGN